MHIPMLDRLRKSRVSKLWLGSEGDIGGGKPPVWLHFRSSKAFIVFTCSFAVFSDVFLYGLIVPVIPFALKDRIGIEEKDVQRWTSILLTIYGAGLLAGSPVCGWWADKSETRQRPFIAGLILLAASTLMLALATHITVLVVARIIQGLSGALVWTVAMAMLTDRVGSKDLGANMGMIVIARSVAILLAPLLGGIIYARAGYVMVYATAFIFLGADVVLRLIMIEARTAQKWDPSIGRRQVELDENTKTPNPENIEKAGMSMADKESSSHIQAKKGTMYVLAHRLPPFITLLGSMRLLVALWGWAVQAIILGVFDSVIPIFVHRTFGWDSSGAGLVFLALIIPTFMSPIVGWLSDKHGQRWYATAGYILSMIPLILLRLVQKNTLHDKIVFCVLLAFTGAFLIFFEIPLQVEIALSVEEKIKENPRHYGGKGPYAQAYGLGNLVFAFGLMVGPLWGGFANERAGWGVLTLSLGLMCGVSAIPSIIWTGGNIFKIKKERKTAPELVQPPQAAEKVEPGPPSTVSPWKPSA
ncbi:hypothetical protein AJ80_05883 [Polytolypa hystricis UAMH7299]|uniref:Major facilitator superfamily (MFS) profile domain-containing protein n=1 Tax=Polytolypa hystricis (strain UAMH7299) TaxID=1447883 RepID=A0A2B7Y0K1_POLH7|nr:hypothetical protein AJ80_05883 [Polytolypa hystricis UAMH7299]